jgi:hypothetical protein
MFIIIFKVIICTNSGGLFCDGFVGDYVLEIYEWQLNSYVNEKEVYLKNEEIKRIKEENKKKDEEIEKRMK